MKKTLLALALLFAVGAQAADLQVPPGEYSGHGSWSDNLGNKGSLYMKDKVAAQPDGSSILTSYAKFSNPKNKEDVREFPGVGKTVFVDETNWQFMVEVAPNTWVPIGGGYSSPGFYNMTRVNLNPTGTLWVAETAIHNERGDWGRLGKVVDETVTPPRITDYRIFLSKKK